MVVGDFAGKDVVTAELAHNDAGIADDFAGAAFNGFLVFGVAVEEVNGVFETGGGDVVEEAGEGLFTVVGKMPDDEGDAEAVGENGVIILEFVEMGVVQADHTDMVKALDFGGGEVFEQPGREVGAEQVEIGAAGGAEMAEAALVAGEDVDSVFGFVEGLEGRGGGGKDGRGAGFRGQRSGSRSGGRGERRLRHRRATDEMNPALVQPELDFFVTALVGGGLLEDDDVNAAVVVEVGDDGVGEFGDGAGADVAFDAVFVLVHKEESVGSVKVAIETFVGFGEGGGLVGRQGIGIVKDLVAATFKVTAPIGDGFGEFAGTGNDNCFHRCMGWVE